MLSQAFIGDGRYSRLLWTVCVFLFCSVSLVRCSPPDDTGDAGTKCSNNRDCSESEPEKCGGGKCLCQSGTCTVRTNDPPEADAGNDQTVRLGQKVFLNGNNSFDKNGDPITFAWSIVTQPTGSVVTLDVVDQAQTSFTPDKDGSYELQLEVSDGKSKATDTVTITVTRGANNAPTAKVNEPQTVAVGATVQLDGTQSSDPDKDKLTFKWTLDVPTGSQAKLSDAASDKPTFVADVAGEYKASLEVSDGEKTDSASVVITAVADFDKEPVIDKLDPARAPAGAPATIKIIGKQFTQGAVVLFRSREVKPTSESATELVVQLDLLLVTAGKYPVVVKNSNSRQSQPVDLEVFEVAAPVVTKVTPEKAGTGSKPTLVITGSNFVTGSEVYFTGTKLPTKTNSDTELEATLDLTGISIGVYPIRVRNPGGKDSNIVNFEVTVPPPPPEITIINPEEAKEGDIVDFTVFGKRFNQGSKILLDGNPIPTKFVSVGEMKADPKLDLTNVPGGIHKISVQDNQGYKSAEVDFKVLGQFPIATLTSVSPTSGVTQSITPVTITGTSIDPQAKVIFDGKPAKTSTFLSSTQIKAELDLQTVQPGSYKLWVENPGKSGPQKSNELSFTVSPLPPPSISSLTHGPLYKGQKGTIELTGQGFTPQMTIEISNRGTRSTSTSYCRTNYLPTSVFTVKVPLQYISSTKARTTFTMPTNFSSSSDNYFGIRVVRGTQDSNFVCFAVSTSTTPPTPVLTALSPVAVNAGSTSPVKVTLSGSSFEPFSIVYFNKKQVQTVTYRSSSTLDAYFDITGLAEGSYDVEVENSSGLKTAVQKFTILKQGQPLLQSVSPNDVYGGNAYTLTLRGTGFDAKSTVEADGKPITGNVTFNSATQITVTSAVFQSTKPTSIAIVVVNPGGLKSNPFSINLRLYAAPTFSSCSPNSFEEGSTSGRITVSGGNFRSAPSMRLPNGKTTQCIYSSSTRAYCDAVDFAGLPQGKQDIQMMNPDGQLSNTYSITITPPVPATISSISPTTALNNQVITLTVNGTRFGKSSVIVFGSKVFQGTYVSASQLKAQIDLKGIPQGIVQVKVRNVVAGKNIDSNGSNFIVLEPPTPTISYFSPMRGRFGSNVTVNFYGTGFNAGTKVSLNGVDQKVTSTTETQLTATLDLTKLKQGPQSIVLDNGPTKKSAQVYFYAVDAPAPSVRDVRPAGVVQSLNNTSITMYGTNFDPQATVTLRGAPIAANITSTTASFQVPFPSQLYPANSKLEVRITNPNGSSDAGYVYVMDPTSPLINYVNPVSAIINRTVELDVYGVGSLSGALLFIDGQQRTYSNRGSYLRLSGFAVGNQSRNIEVKVQLNGKFSNPYFFQVTPETPPQINYLQPPFGKQGSTVNLTIKGSYFDTSGPTVRIDGKDYTVSSSGASSSSLSISIPLTGFSPGPKTLQVRNPDNQSSETVYFTVTP